MEIKPWYDPEQKLPENGQAVLMAYDFGEKWLYVIGEWDIILHEWYDMQENLQAPPMYWQEITPPDAGFVPTFPAEFGG